MCKEDKKQAWLQLDSISGLSFFGVWFCGSFLSVPWINLVACCSCLLVLCWDTPRTGLFTVVLKILFKNKIAFLHFLFLPVGLYLEGETFVFLLVLFKIVSLCFVLHCFKRGLKTHAFVHTWNLLPCRRYICWWPCVTHVSKAALSCMLASSFAGEMN